MHKYNLILRRLKDEKMILIHFAVMKRKYSDFIQNSSKLIVLVY